MGNPTSFLSSNMVWALWWLIMDLGYKYKSDNFIYANNTSRTKVFPPVKIPTVSPSCTIITFYKYWPSVSIFGKNLQNLDPRRTIPLHALRFNKLFHLFYLVKFILGAFLGIKLGLGWTKKDPMRYPSTSLIIDILIKSTNYKFRRVAVERTVKDRNLRTEITSFIESGDKRFHYLG